MTLKLEKEWIAQALADSFRKGFETTLDTMIEGLKNAPEEMTVRELIALMELDIPRMKATFVARYDQDVAEMLEKLR